MYKRSDFTKPAYKTAEIMEILNVSYSTIKNYDKQGKLSIQRTETGRRFVLREDLLNYLDSLKDHKDDSLSTKEILELIKKDDTENDYF